MLKTKSGRYIIFDATDPNFYQGKISSMFNEAAKNGYWFFQPSEWVPAPGSNDYGCTAACLTKTLMPYSAGYSTPEAALAAAEEWEAERRMYDEVFGAAMSL